MEEYGRHFNNRLYRFAVSKMTDSGNSSPQPWDREKIDDFLRSNGVTVKNNVGYDAAYVLSMCMADYFGSSIADDKHLALFVKDFLDDPDGYETKAFDHFYIDCMAKGIPVFWDEML